jgi:16S rRNA processing protein RimM
MLMMRDLVEVARVGRPHGLKGEVVVKLVTDREERVAPGMVLHSDRGDLVVATSRRHQQRWLVRFEGSGSREDAEALRGLVLQAEPLDDPDEMWVHDLVGAEVVLVGTGEVIGTCVSLVANPASDLLELDDGSLIPVVFVVEHTPGRVVVDPPEGLLDL